MGDKTFTPRRSAAYFFLTVSVVSLYTLYAWHVWTIRYSVSDAVAQFLPVSIEGYRAIKSGHLPLFNFYQYLGHPVLEMAYFPVLYPLFWLSCFISEHLLNEIQLAWDVLGTLQTVFTGVAAFLFFDRALKLRSPLLSMLGAVTVAFIGNNLYMRGEFFYGTVCYAFVPLILVCAKELLTSATPLNALWFALSVYFFVVSSNVQYVFYSAHIIAFGLWAILQANNIPFAITVRRQWKPLCAAALLTLLLLLPYLYGMAEFQVDSVRQTTKVALSEYFWTRNDPLNAWLHMPLPLSGETDPAKFYQVPYSSYCGPLVFLAAIFSPIFLIWAFATKKSSFVARIFPLFLAALLFYLLSIGEPGQIGRLLYYVPPYNWFRHSTKWIPFFQMSVAYMGFLLWDIFFETFVRNQKIKFFALSICTVLTLSCTAWAITISQVPKRLTEVEVPLPKPVLALDSEYRHVGIWSNVSGNGGEYKTDMPARLLCFNFGTLWKLPMLAGYEPRAWKNNLELAKGNWFPGCYYKFEDIDLNYFTRWGVRYFRIPKDDSAKALQYFKSYYPSMDIVDAGIDPTLDISVLENKSAPKLVSGDTIVTDQIKIKSANRVVAKIRAAQPGPVIFAWAYDPYMHARVDGHLAEAKSDEFGRIQVMLKSPGRHKVEISYAPKVLLRLYKYCTVSFLLIGGGIIVRFTWRKTFCHDSPTT